jgi:hypothetical protein
VSTDYQGIFTDSSTEQKFPNFPDRSSNEVNDILELEKQSGVPLNEIKRPERNSQFINVNKLPVIHENGTLYRVKSKQNRGQNKKTPSLKFENALAPKKSVSSIPPRPKTSSMYTGNFIFTKLPFGKHLT